MADNRWFRRILAGTRGQIATRLRAGPATINELVDGLNLSANAVRSHLAALERDGLVEQDVRRQGVGKPAHLYRLTEDANSLNPKAYHVVLGTLLDALRANGDAAAYNDVLDAVARRLAGDVGKDDSFESRLAATLELLAALGADVTVERREGAIELRGSDCPLARLVGPHPELCSVLAGVIAQRLQVEVTDCCERAGALPRCLFRARLPSAA